MIEREERINGGRCLNLFVFLIKQKIKYAEILPSDDIVMQLDSLMENPPPREVCTCTCTCICGRDNMLHVCF